MGTVGKQCSLLAAEGRMRFLVLKGLAKLSLFMAQAGPQPSSADQCCPLVAVLSMTQPESLPWAKRKSSKLAMEVSGLAHGLNEPPGRGLESTGLPEGGSSSAASSSLCCLPSDTRFFWAPHNKVLEIVLCVCACKLLIFKC